MRASLVAAQAAFAASVLAQPADLVLRNGKIVTMNAAAPVAQAIAVRGDKIAGLGSDSAAQRWIGPNTKVIDLHGMLAIPGFIEGHGHFTGVGEFRMGLERGRLAVALDLLTDALVLVGQHGVYCQSARQPGKPAMDVQMISECLTGAKELVTSVMAELQLKKSQTL
jgi:adenine deaminase